jgi:NAD-dependent deacetylase
MISDSPSLHATALDPETKLSLFFEVLNMAPIQEVTQWVRSAQQIVVLTGAGISTDSGIPDFRGPNGVWTRNPAAEKQSTIQNYLADQEVRKAAWQSRLANPAWSAKPNAGHQAIVELERCGKLHALITQNIDELHQQAGNSAAKVIEVHGTIRRVMCWSCGDRAPMESALARVRAGETDPHCQSCGGILKSDTISFGQALIPEVIDQAMRVASEADLFIAVGSTLQVFPVAGVVPIAKRSGARVVIVNAQATAMDDLADALLTGSISELLPIICSSNRQSSHGP